MHNKQRSVTYLFVPSLPPTVVALPVTSLMGAKVFPNFSFAPGIDIVELLNLDPAEFETKRREFRFNTQYWHGLVQFGVTK